MKAIHVETRHILSPWILITVTVAFFVALVLLLYAFWVKPIEHQPVLLSRQLSILTSVFAYPATPVLERAVVKPVDVPFADRGKKHEVGELPKYGAEAMGQPGAWDGSSGITNDSYSEFREPKDYLGKSCIHYARHQLPIETLRALLPPDGYTDECNYLNEFAFHEDLPPDDFFSVKLDDMSPYLYSRDIVRFYGNKHWKLSDFERLVHIAMTDSAAFELFVLLSDRGSFAAAEVRKLYGSFVGQEMEEFLRSGSCPDEKIYSDDGPCGAHPRYTK